MECELLKGCVFFNMPENVTQPHAIKVLKEVYCKGNYLLCARRQVVNAVGREHVPPELNPNHTHLVRDIITAALAKQ